MSKPNILFIFSDQHRGEALSCVGDSPILTPNLSRMASEGALFTRCHTNGPLCMASRASMMTGQYLRQHGVWDNTIECDANSPSHVRNIRDAGYHTALVGKTHLYVHGGIGAGHSRDKVQILKDWGSDDIHELHGPHASGVHPSPYSDYLTELGLWETHRDYVVNSKTHLEAGQARPWKDPPCPLPSESHLEQLCRSYSGRVDPRLPRRKTLLPPGSLPGYTQPLRFSCRIPGYVSAGRYARGHHGKPQRTPSPLYRQKPVSGE